MELLDAALVLPMLLVSLMVLAADVYDRRDAATAARLES